MMTGQNRHAQRLPDSECRLPGGGGGGGLPLPLPLPLPSGPASVATLKHLPIHCVDLMDLQFHLLFLLAMIVLNEN